MASQVPQDSHAAAFDLNLMVGLPDCLPGLATLKACRQVTRLKAGAANAAVV